MSNKVIVLLLIIAGVLLPIGLLSNRNSVPKVSSARDLPDSQSRHWFMLYRKSNKELLYFGVPGQSDDSVLLKTFQVKAGVPGKKPTPLPQLAGKEYWRIVEKFSSADNPETAPYFLAFDTPTPSVYPYGPEPYTECGGQCDWEIPGYFGLHGVGGNGEKLADADPGSSGCVRHSDSDITYLYNLLDPGSEEIRYYIKDI